MRPIVDELAEQKNTNEDGGVRVDDMKSQLHAQGEKLSADALATVVNALASWPLAKHAAAGQTTVRALDGRFSHGEVYGPRPPSGVRVERQKSKSVRALTKEAISARLVAQLMERAAQRGAAPSRAWLAAKGMTPEQFAKLAPHSRAALQAERLNQAANKTYHWVQGDQSTGWLSAFGHTPASYAALHPEARMALRSQGIERGLLRGGARDRSYQASEQIARQYPIGEGQLPPQAVSVLNKTLGAQVGTAASGRQLESLYRMGQGPTDAVTSSPSWLNMLHEFGHAGAFRSPLGSRMYGQAHARGLVGPEGQLLSRATQLSEQGANRHIAQHLPALRQTFMGAKMPTDAAWRQYSQHQLEGYRLNELVNAMGATTPAQVSNFSPLTRNLISNRAQLMRDSVRPAPAPSALPQPSGSTMPPVKFAAWKLAAQDSSKPQRSAAGESLGLTFATRDDDNATGEKAWEVDRFVRRDSAAYGKKDRRVQRGGTDKKASLSTAVYVPVGAGVGYGIGGEQGALIGAGAGAGAGLGANAVWLGVLNPRLRARVMRAMRQQAVRGAIARRDYTRGAREAGNYSPRKALGLEIQEHAKAPLKMYGQVMRDPSTWKLWGAGVGLGGMTGGVGTAAMLNKTSAEKRPLEKYAFLSSLSAMLLPEQRIVTRPSARFEEAIEASRHDPRRLAVESSAYGGSNVGAVAGGVPGSLAGGVLGYKLGGRTGRGKLGALLTALGLGAGWWAGSTAGAPLGENVARHMSEKSLPPMSRTGLQELTNRVSKQSSDGQPVPGRTTKRASWWRPAWQFTRGLFNSGALSGGNARKAINTVMSKDPMLAGARTVGDRTAAINLAAEEARRLAGTGQALPWMSGAWNAGRTVAPQVAPTAFGGLMGGLYGSDLTGEREGWNSFLGGAGAGMAAFNPRLRRMAGLSGWRAPVQAVRMGSAGSFAGSGLDATAGVFGVDTNGRFGQAGAWGGTALGGGGATLGALGRRARPPAAPPGGAVAGPWQPKPPAAAANTWGNWARAADVGTSKLDRMLTDFGSGVFMRPVLEPLKWVARRPWEMSGKPMSQGVRDWIGAVPTTTKSDALGRMVGYTGMGVAGLGTGWNLLRGKLDETIQDNIAKAYGDVRDQVKHDLGGAVGLHPGGMLHRAQNLVDVNLMRIGINPAHLTPAQKLQILGGTLGGTLGAATGNPWLAAGGFGAAALPFMNDGGGQQRQQYADPMLDEQMAGRLTGQGW